MNIKVETCAESAFDIIESEKGGAVRSELNSSLFFGGLTPSLGEFLEAKEKTEKIKIICMVRPRAGGFCYTDSEYEVMKRDAKLFLENGADGISFGFLNEDGTIDEKRTKEMVSFIGEKEAVFHRAFDMTPNWKEAIDTLISCNVKRILTSGQKKSAYEGRFIIKEMIDYADGRIEILPGAGIRPENIKALIDVTKCDFYHVSSRKDFSDLSLSCNKEISFTGDLIPDETYYKVMDSAALNQLILKINEK